MLYRVWGTSRSWYCTVSWSSFRHEVVHCDSKGVEDFGIDGVFVEINQIHLLLDLLHGCFGAQRGYSEPL